MTLRPAARRLPALGCVLLAHVLALSALFMLTRPAERPRKSETESLVWLPLTGAAHPEAAPMGTARAPVRPRAPERSAAAPPGNLPSAAPDWSADAASAADAEAGAIELRGRQSRALVPPVSALTRPPARHAPPFHWDPAHTERVKPLATGGTLLRLSERCALVLYFVIPMGGCALGEIPARADLFDHMRDPPGLGDWKDK